METEWMNETSAEAPSVPAPEKTEKKKFSLKGFGGKKKKRWLKILIILVVVIAIVAGCVSRLTKNVNTQLSSSYLVSTVTRQDLTVSVSGTATLQPADSYNVTTLLSGDIVSAPFEEGDLVTKDTLLYTMDSSDAQDSMDRAQINFSINLRDEVGQNFLLAVIHRGADRKVVHAGEVHVDSLINY